DGASSGAGGIGSVINDHSGCTVAANAGNSTLGAGALALLGLAVATRRRRR
ncbi:MAG: hypothetical protein JNK04_21660, partial [Myxococcales bacterium]|nr:hypothetical protein [Myxococcales bacterium]